jgi:hypothetical protein
MPSAAPIREIHLQPDPQLKSEAPRSSNSSSAPPCGMIRLLSGYKPHDQRTDCRRRREESMRADAAGQGPEVSISAFFSHCFLRCLRFLLFIPPDSPALRPQISAFNSQLLVHRPWSVVGGPAVSHPGLDYMRARRTLFPLRFPSRHPRNGLTRMPSLLLALTRRISLTPSLNWVYGALDTWGNRS